MVKAVTISLHPSSNSTSTYTHISYPDKVALFLGTLSGDKSFSENVTGTTPQCSLLQLTPLGVSSSSLVLLCPGSSTNDWTAGQPV